MTYEKLSNYLHQSVITLCLHFKLVRDFRSLITVEILLGDADDNKEKVGAPKEEGW
jgi:hypothetical protein